MNAKEKAENYQEIVNAMKKVQKLLDEPDTKGINELNASQQKKILMYYKALTDQLEKFRPTK